MASVNSRPSRSWGALLALAILALAPIYFALGAVAVPFLGPWTWDKYLTGAGIVGGVASIVSLVGAARPRSLANELKQVETSTIQSLQAASDELQRLSEKSREAEGRISELQLQQQRMEVAVRKASLALFLEDQASFSQKRILDEVEKNPRIRAALDDLQQQRKGLLELEKTIEEDEDVKLLRGLLDDERRKRDREDVLRGLPLYPLVRPYVELMRALQTLILR